MKGVRLPAIDARVELRSGCCDAAVHPSRVEDVVDEHMIVAAPLAHPGKARLPDRGDHVLVAWTEERGRFELRGAFVGVRLHRLGTWLLEPDGHVTFEQRRRFARVSEAAPLELWVGGRSVPATMIDLSEGGFRCVVRTQVDAGAGDDVATSIELFDGAIDARGVIVRSAPLAPDLTVFGMAFTDLPRSSADRIRRHVFSKQVRLRAIAR